MKVKNAKNSTPISDALFLRHAMNNSYSSFYINIIATIIFNITHQFLPLKNSQNYYYYYYYFLQLSLYSLFSLVASEVLSQQKHLKLVCINFNCIPDCQKKVNQTSAIKQKFFLRVNSEF